MKNCPECGQPRLGEAFKCPSCDVFYSQLDELLFAEQQKQQQASFKGQLAVIFAAEDRAQAGREFMKGLWINTPLKTKITLWTILAFVFVLVFGLL